MSFGVDAVRLEGSRIVQVRWQEFDPVRDPVRSSIRAEYYCPHEADVAIVVEALHRDMDVFLVDETEEGSLVHGPDFELALDGDEQIQVVNRMVDSLPTF